MSISFTGEVPRGFGSTGGDWATRDVGPTLETDGPSEARPLTDVWRRSPLGTSPVKEIDTETGGEEKKCRKSS